ncbi:hypothetical protein [Sphingomonas sp. BK235]|uniref:hypothetical protein n=1 Tax=Sphingomonas sp. BK235 TaxID=2512131 RepID=UPI001FB69A41|nr:hypothetical protein [Sphingomonas sp. BK235]
MAAAYTYVRGDVGVDVGANPSVDQFALLGLSDTANATLIYDKHGVSARLAYNWRGRFSRRQIREVTAIRYSSSRSGQLDMNVSYDISANWSVSLEKINSPRKASAPTIARAATSPMRKSSIDASCSASGRASKR